MHMALYITNRFFGWGSLLCGIVLLAGTPALAEVASTRYPVMPEQVASAMREKHLPLEGARVILGTPMSATVAGSVLEVKSVAMTDQYHARVRVACRRAGECLPFYASVSWPEDAPKPDIPADVLQSFRSSNDAVGKAAAGSVEDRSTTDRVRNEARKTPAALKAGAPATLIIDENRIHIRLKVVCLQGGAEGDKVRVATPDRKQAYVGEVMTPTLLKGSL